MSTHVGVVSIKVAVLLLAIFFFQICRSGAVCADEIRGRVIRALDGDSLLIDSDGRNLEVRLFGIDCPEWDQPFGRQAARTTSGLTRGREIRMDVMGRDKYDRLLATVFLPGGLNLNRELVRLGLAWWFRRFAPDDKTLRNLEEQAETGKIGLWADKEPIPPWDWRAGRR